MADLAAPAAPLHSEFSLTPDQLASLPPDVRDELLEYLSLWADPEHVLETIALLRRVHGPLLFFLDYEARAQARAGRYKEALGAIDRRQRRSATIASLALEARMLAAAGQAKSAAAAAQALVLAYPRQPIAVATAAEVFAAVGKPVDGQDLLEQFLGDRPGDPHAVLALAQVLLAADQPRAADLALQQLGTGVAADFEDGLVQRLAALHHVLGNLESERTIRLEIERRRQVRLTALQDHLRPLLDIDPALVADSEQFYRLLSGPQSIAITDRERRKIQLEAVRHFGFLHLREGQAETIASILRGESLLVVMPTGAGKSLCYQLPALLFPHATLVISPLIALMKDQVEGLPPAARSLATFINSTLTDEEVAARLSAVAAGKFKLIYAAPERLRQRAFLRALRQAGLSLFVVDEAHCVSMWGHDFRPDYLFLQAAREELGNPPALAITATAPPRVRDEIIDHLSAAPGLAGEQASSTPASDRISRPRVMALDIFRHNIHLSALRYHSEDEKLAALLQFVTQTEGAGVVYVNSRHKSESLAYELRRLDVRAEAYHAGLDNRAEIQDRFMSGATRVVVATIAFGMGIDKADIRFIVHFHPPRSLAAYYQEVGRAGRDGKPSQGVLFYSNNDWANLRRWAKADTLPVEFLEQVHAAIASQLGASPPNPSSPSHGYPVAGLVDTRRLQQVLDAGEVSVRVAISMLERVDVLERSFDFPQESAISLPAAQPSAPIANAAFNRLRKGLSLSAGQSATFKTADIAAFMGWPLHEAETSLLEMERQGLLAVHFARRALLVSMPPPPADMRRRLERVHDQSLAVAQRRIDEIVDYAASDSCRHGYISAHFGSPPRLRCAVCDNCTGRRPDLPVTPAPRLLVDDADIEPMILDCLMSVSKPVGRTGLSRILAGNLRAPAKPDQARRHGQLKALGEVIIGQYIDDLIDTQRLRQYEQNGYPVLAVTLTGRAEAEAWLANNPPPEPAAPDAPSQDANQQDKEPAAPHAGDQYTALQKALWSWRRRLAEEQGVPPYMIMDNNLMLRIADSRPQSNEELAALPGMGEQRLARLGPSILDLVRLHPAQAEDEALLAQQRAAQSTQPSPLPRVKPAPSAPKPVARALYLKLQELRQKIAVAERCTQSEVAGHGLLKAIAAAAPRSLAELERIPGFRSSGLRAHAGQVCAYAVDAWKLAPPPSQ